MKKIIYKYPLHITDEQVIQMPKHCTILSVQIQGGKPCIWAMVEPEAPLVEVKLYVLGTGNPVPDNIIPQMHIGTFLTLGEQFVGHVFIDPKSEVCTIGK